MTKFFLYMNSAHKKTFVAVTVSLSYSFRLCAYFTKVWWVYKILQDWN